MHEFSLPIGHQKGKFGIAQVRRTTMAVRHEYRSERCRRCRSDNQVLDLRPQLRIRRVAAVVHGQLWRTSAIRDAERPG